jgi:hypothetical protein
MPAAPPGSVQWRWWRPPRHTNAGSPRPEVAQHARRRPVHHHIGCTGGSLSGYQIADRNRHDLPRPLGKLHHPPAFAEWRTNELSVAVAGATARQGLSYGRSDTSAGGRDCRNGGQLDLDQLFPGPLRKEQRKRLGRDHAESGAGDQGDSAPARVRIPLQQLAHGWQFVCQVDVRHARLNARVDDWTGVT